MWKINSGVFIVLFLRIALKRRYNKHLVRSVITGKSETLACVAGGFVSGGAAAEPPYYLAGEAREGICKRRSREWNSRLPHFVWFLLAAHFYHFWWINLSAYEVKNNCCLFERLLKLKKNGVFLFGISFLFLEIFTFLYYANEDSDDVIGGSIKTV